MLPGSALVVVGPDAHSGEAVAECENPDDKDLDVHEEVRIMREDRDYWCEWFEAAGVPYVDRVRGPLFNDSTYSLQAASRGEGVALARRSIVLEDLERGILKRLFTLAVPSHERYWFVCPKGSENAPNVKAFRDWMKGELGV